jgi:hypothetical protein
MRIQFALKVNKGVRFALEMLISNTNEVIPIFNDFNNFII